MKMSGIRALANGKLKGVLLLVVCLVIVGFFYSSSISNYIRQEKPSIPLPRSSTTNHLSEKIQEKSSMNSSGDENAKKFVKFYGDVFPKVSHPLPSPRSHVTTNSSHMIKMFARDLGCLAQQRHYIIYQFLKLDIVCHSKTTSVMHCNAWIWDPANWTLILTNETQNSNIYEDHAICASPILTDRVTKIVYPNGTEDLPGCKENRSPCAPVGPYFDKELNMRINNSPCCRHMVTGVLSAAHEVFEKLKIRYVMVGGAVISVGRDNGEFIPYDTDLDLIVDYNQHGKFLKEAQQEMKALGFFFRIHDNGDYVEMCVSEDCLPGVDVWFYENHPNKKNILKYHGMSFWENPESTLFPTSWHMFAGKKYRFPREITKYLDHEYSSGLMAGYKNWEDVFLCNYRHGHKCTHNI